MAERLHVIALISGGKDSFFSLLHCMRNGYEVVALANLYPEVPQPKQKDVAAAGEDEDGEHDLNSFMFQTVGHTIIPLYEKSLGIPLYRQQITGGAVQTGTSYSHADISPDGASDETESLVPLLKRVMRAHPSANALCTGAILSTYQRTRIESVALRLGLTPVSYLWKYPVLPPATQTSLLEDMSAVGMDARIVKVASGGLDEGFLWANVAGAGTPRRIERALARFGAGGDGSVIGEGGEFETVVLDGPRKLFRERIVVEEGDWDVVREGGGAAWLRVREARTTGKDEESGEQECRVPDLFDSRFEDMLRDIQKEELPEKLDGMGAASEQSIPPYDFPEIAEVRQGDVLYWTITAKDHTNQDISHEARKIITELQSRLTKESIRPSDITCTTIVLRSMGDFQAVNQVYGSIFTHPNPPSRVTISCGPAMPTGINIILHLKISLPSIPRRGLHVQSRSYWAPANIGPYSQAISTSPSSQDSWTVHIAGQIALVPASMQLPPTSATEQETFSKQTVLSLQHLFRIAAETQARSFSSAVAYLPHTSALRIQIRAVIAGRAWTLAHTPPESDDEEDEDAVPDLWEQRHNYQNHQTQYLSSTSMTDSGSRASGTPPFFAVEVDALPRAADVEWHAHVGITDAARVSSEEGDGWRMDHCEVERRRYSVFRLFWDARARGLGEVPGREAVYASYLDVSAEAGMRGDGMNINMPGLVPCRSIWDAEGRRIAAVLLLDRAG